MDAGLLVTQILVGLNRAAMLFLFTVGLQLIWGTLHIINFSHGALYLLGAYFTYSFVGALSHISGGFWIALVLGPVCVSIVGGLIEVFLFRPLYRRLVFEQLTLAWGLIFLLSGCMLAIWGPLPKTINFPPFLTGTFRLWGQFLSVYSAFVTAIGIVVGVVIWYVYYRTRFGRELRAVAQDREMAGALGIDHQRVFTATFCLGTFLAGVAGALLGGSTVIQQGADVAMLIPAFMVVIMGGFLTYTGTILAALIVGLVEAFGFFWMPQVGAYLIYIVVGVVLIIRPWGLLGKPISD